MTMAVARRRAYATHENLERDFFQKVNAVFQKVNAKFWKLGTALSPMHHFLSLIRTSDFVEGTFVRESKEKSVFSLLFSHLFVPLQQNCGG